MIRRVFRHGSTRLPIGTLSALTAALVLSACATSPAPVSPQPEARPQPPSAAGSKPKVVQKKGGGYYKDDGPGDDIPGDLDSVPDAEPKAEPLHRFANNPYNVFGKEYVPAQQVAPYREQGLASWYGRKFHGKPTSSGEKYDMYGMTAAHPTLPIPSYARVTNLRNGKAVIVRINDRGPFHSGRAIDMSYAAAYKLDYLSTGHTDVEIEAIVPEGIEVIAANVPPIRQRGPAPKRAPLKPVPPEPLEAASARPATPPPAPARVEAPVIAAAPISASAVSELKPLGAPAPAVQKTGGIFLQLGAFASAANAESFRKFVSHEMASLADQLQVLALDGRFRLHAGPYASESEARGIADRISAALRFKPFVITR